MKNLISFIVISFSSSKLTSGHVDTNKSSILYFKLNENLKTICTKIAIAATALSISATSLPQPSIAALTYDLTSDVYKNTFVNLPTDDFWYPPFLIGKWKTNLKFRSASFTNKVDPQLLFEEGNLPGIDKYSVIFLPEMGTDINEITMRFVQLDSHPRDDHPANLRSLAQASSKTTTIDSAPYFFQKAPDWFHSRANDWSINYHDPDGEGHVQLTTKKRFIQVFAGSVETIEVFHQVHERQGRAITGDYAINWKLAVPAALRDEFINVQDLSNTKVIQGELNILAYLESTNNLYRLLPASPAAVYTYDVTMERADNGRSYVRDTKYTGPRIGKQLAPPEARRGLIGEDSPEEVKRASNPVYPFVFRDAGPIDSLEGYFGY